MKKYISAILAFTIIGFTASAQTKETISSEKKEIHKNQGKWKQGQHKANMMKDLNLSERQKQEAKSIWDTYQSQTKVLSEDKSLSHEDFLAKRSELTKEQRSKFQSLLTPEQKAKMSEKKNPNKNKGGKMKGNRGEKMKDQLNLSDDQAAKMKSQHQILRTQAKAIHENTSLSEDQKKEQMKDLRNRTKELEKTILTAEQVQKREEMRKNRFNEIKSRKSEKS
ncbi:MAG: hypothetical protein ABIR19_07055 [Ginsengibacter sp.]